MTIKPLKISTYDTRTWQVNLKDDSGSAVNLSAATVTGALRKVGESTNWFSSATFTVSSDGTTGIVTFSPTSAQTISAGSYELELKVVDSGSKTQHTYDLIPVLIRTSFQG